MSTGVLQGTVSANEMLSHGVMKERPPDDRCEEIAARQHGVFQRAQALACGMSDRAIEHRLASGRWLRILPGVYCLRGTLIEWKTMLMAVCLWAKGVVSHRAAALLWGMDGVEEEIVEVTSTLRRRPPPGVIVHRAPSGGLKHTVRFKGFIVTDPTSTLIDLASVVDARTLETAMDAALRQRRTYPSLVLSRLDELGARGRRGTAFLRKLAEERAAGAKPTESALEVEAESFLTANGLCPPERQHWVTGPNGERRRLDFAWPELRVGIEVDSHQWHEGFKALETDVARSNFYIELGWKVLRLTRRVMRRDGSLFIGRLSRLIGQTELEA